MAISKLLFSQLDGMLEKQKLWRIGSRMQLLLFLLNYTSQMVYL